MNYFELFGLPVTFIVDQDQLMRKYFELQKATHPDFFTQGSGAEQEEALERSSMINTGLKTLRNPDATIKYILKEKGVLEEEEKYQLSPDFLMEMMELNEEMDESTPEKIRDQEKLIYEPVRDLIEKYDDARSTPADLALIKDYYFKKKYLDRILDRLAG